MAPRSASRPLTRGLLSAPIARLLLTFLLTFLVTGLLACPSTPPVDERTYRIAPGDRLALTPDDLADRTSIVFHLGLEDDGDAPSRTARVAAQDGRRLDARVERVPGVAHTFRLEIEAAFLRPGGYLIEIDGLGSPALNVRRYIVEVAVGTPAR